MTISIPLQPPLVSSAATYFKRTSSLHPPKQESDLLRSIRIALRGTDTNLVSSIHSSAFPATSRQFQLDDELTWNDEIVLLSNGGVVVKKWSFTAESQPIQWACIGWLEQTTSAAQSNPPPQSKPSTEPLPGRPTFGPFVRAPDATPAESERQAKLIPAVFVFLRSIGRIFVHNGLDYTFSLPFIVRQAWPVAPHGVMIQRALEPGELEEAELSGDDVLPTIFCVTSPFAEAGAVGLTKGISGGYSPSNPAALQDEDAHSLQPLKSVPPTEIVLWVARVGDIPGLEVLVTVDIEKRKLSIWRYVYVKSNDLPRPVERRKRNRSPRRKSVVLPTSPDIAPNALDLPDFPQLPPMSSLPGMPPSLSSTATMSSIASGSAPTQWSATSQPPSQTRGRRNSLTRNDLSVTMDRMVLGTKLDSDISLGPIHQDLMRPSFWMERLYSLDLSDTE